MENNPFDRWQIEYNSGIPVYRQIINQVAAAVASGSFKTGDQLPTIRLLSERLNVNPNTVAKAYRELELKGVILSERGSGSFIQPQPATPTPPPAEKKAALKKIYQRFLAEAASNGLTEEELLTYLKKQNLSIL
jgi:GntR family transcriptional regulator